MKWLIAAGGTGGHVFPAVSLAQALMEEDPQGKVLMVGTKRGLEARIVPKMGMPFTTLPVKGIAGVNWWGKLRAAGLLPWAALKCLWILLSFKPHAVIGMGGYVAGPIVLIAYLLRIPNAVAEQNAVSGRTNKLLGRFSSRIFLAFAEAGRDFPEDKTVVCGNPVRRELLEAAMGSSPPQWNAREGEEFHLLVFGGSQGAKAIDEAFLEAMPLLRKFPYPLSVVHQTAASRVEKLAKAYNEAGIQCQVLSFIEKMEEAYLWAHLVVCRAGAMSLAEIALFGLPSILVPFPYATDDHQKRNAQVWESNGAGVILEQGSLNGEKLFEALVSLASDPERLQKMATKAKSLAAPDAARNMARECLKLVTEGRHEG